MLKNLRWYQRVLVYLLIGAVVLAGIAKLIAFIAYGTLAVAVGAVAIWWIRRAQRKAAVR